jgi:hypothetical protein
VDRVKPNPIWPVDLDAVRLWPMEGEDGPLLQELFDDLRDFRTAFGEPGAADAVGTFINLPEGLGYESKLLIGIWKKRRAGRCPRLHPRLSKLQRVDCRPARDREPLSTGHRLVSAPVARNRGRCSGKLNGPRTGSPNQGRRHRLCPTLRIHRSRRSGPARPSAGCKVTLTLRA